MSIQFRNAIASRLKGGPQDIDILHWTSRTALELIGQSGLFYVFLFVWQADYIHILLVYRSWYMSRHFHARLLTCGLGYSFDNPDDGPPNEYSTVVKNLMFVSSFSTHLITVGTHLKLSRLIGRPWRARI